MISRILKENAKNFSLRDDMKLAQLMQNDEFMSQLQSNPEYRDALAQGAIELSADSRSG